MQAWAWQCLQQLNVCCNMVEAMGLQRTFWFVKILAILCHFSWSNQMHGFWSRSQLSATGFCHFLWWAIVLFWTFFRYPPPQLWNEELLLCVCVCVAFQSCAELQPFQVELLFGSKTYPKNRKCSYKWQQLAGRTCSDAILELLLIFSTQFQVKHPFKLIRAITVSLEYQWRNWSRECNLSTSWILRRC